MESGDRILVAAGLTAAVVVGAFVFWGPGGAPKVRKRRGQIAGLQNLGRTCFLNTLIQAFAACPSFIEWLKQYSKNTGNNSMITTLYTVVEVVNGYHEQARGTPVCPLGVLQCLKAAGWVLPPEQHDAHELLHALLACLEEEVQAIHKKPGCLSDALGLSMGGGRAWSALASPASPPNGVWTRAESTPPTPSARPASAAPPPEPDLVMDAAPPPGRLAKGVSRSFCQLSGTRRWAVSAPRAPPAPPVTRGTLASTLTCTVCAHKSPVRYDKFDSITLPMTNTSIGINGTFTLQGLLRALTAPEMVSGVRCTKCSPEPTRRPDGGADPVPDTGYTKHIKTVSFGKVPLCLCIHIGRVEWRGGALCKRGERVAFPEHLSLAPYTHAQPQSEISPPSRPREAAAAAAAALPPRPAARVLYVLRAAVLHAGGPNAGHFATYRRGNGIDSQRWWYTSDTIVHEVSLQEVLHCSAYMLFYERVRPEPAPPHCPPGGSLGGLGAAGGRAPLSMQ